MEEPNKKTLKKTVFTEKLGKYLNKKAGGNFKCVVCKNEKMYLLGMEKDDVDMSGDYTGNRVLGVSCVNCGFTSFFDFEAVVTNEDWL